MCVTSYEMCYMHARYFIFQICSFYYMFIAYDFSIVVIKKKMREVLSLSQSKFE